MTDAEKRIEKIWKMANTNHPDNQVAHVFALCEIARQLARLGDLYQFELGVDVVEPVEPDPSELIIVPQDGIED